MSRETVYALRCFTQKLQKAAAEADPELVLPTAPEPVAPAPRGVSPGKGLVPNITKPPKPFSVADIAPKSETPPAQPEGQSWMDMLAGLGQYMPSMPVMGGIGLGGLGAYGLARMMRSKKDEEEDKFPWLSTVLGMAGGGALAHYLANRNNLTIEPAAPGADYALYSPNALPATGGPMAPENTIPISRIA